MHRSSFTHSINQVLKSHWVIHANIYPVIIYSPCINKILPILESISENNWERSGFSTGTQPNTPGSLTEGSHSPEAIRSAAGTGTSQPAGQWEPPMHTAQQLPSTCGLMAFPRCTWQYSQFEIV